MRRNSIAIAIMKITLWIAKMGKQFGILLALLLALIAIVYCSSRVLLGSVRDSLLSHAAPAASYEEALRVLKNFNRATDSQLTQ